MSDHPVARRALAHFDALFPIEEPLGKRASNRVDQKPTVIDLFCGAGGLSEGFRQAGFTVVAGSDLDVTAGQTFLATHPEAAFFPGRIQDLKVGSLLQATGLASGELDVLVGGPPCQGYSVYNHNRGADDPRAGLFKEYLRIVGGLRPRWLIMENVSGLTSIANGAIIREIEAGMATLGYAVRWKILKAEEYGVPQERRRIFFIANRIGAPISFPTPTHGTGLRPFVTIWDAIGDLPELENGGRHPSAPYRSNPMNDYQAELRDAELITNHAAPKLSPINEARMKHIPAGGSWRDIPFDLLPEGMKRAKRSDHTKRYGRPRKSDLSCTILTKCDVHWGAYIHPGQDRAITVREAARLQSFPDSFEFKGSQTEQYVQVGNAVPPLLGRAVAAAVLDADSAMIPDFETSCAAA